MTADTRRRVVLAALLVALAVVMGAQWRRTRTPGASQEGPLAAARGQAGRAAGALPTVPTVALIDLGRAREGPGASARNPFRQRAAPPSPAPMRGVQGGAGGVDGVSAGPASPAGPPPPPPKPPVPLKFVGLVRMGPDRVRVAVLSDGASVFYGKEGDIVDGRYRIARLGDQTVVVTYLDGTGSTPLRLPGS